MDHDLAHVSLLTLTPISKRGKPLSTTPEPDELRELRAALRSALAVPDGDAPPAPVTDWRSDWPRLVDLGLPGLCVPEDRGGAGNRADAAVVAAVVVGAALHGAPLAGLVTAAALLGGADHAGASALLEDVLTGARACVFAPHHGGSDTGTANGTSTATATVAGAESADALLLLDPRTGGLLLAPEPTAWSLTPSPSGDFDRTRTVGSAVVRLDACTALASPRPDALQLYRLLLAADALGGLEQSLARAVAYSGQRSAFGKVLGGFQAVQHRLVDHTIRVRGLSLALTEAARHLTDGTPGAARAVLLAESAISTHTVRILHDLVQLTGGIGFTWEHGLHLFERRAQADALLAANPRRARHDLAALEGWTR